MSQVGDRAKGTDIDRKTTDMCIYYACPDCGFARWIETIQLKRHQGRCNKCAGKAKTGKPNYLLRGVNNGSWKGGRLLLKSGYIRVPMYPEDPLVKMARHDAKDSHYYILEHRLVMGRHLGHCLEPWEVVHHLNGNRSDNRLENLELLPSQVEHSPSILLQQEVNKLRERVKELESRVTLLEAEKVLEMSHT